MKWLTTLLAHWDKKEKPIDYLHMYDDLYVDMKASELEHLRKEFMKRNKP